MSTTVPGRMPPFQFTANTEFPVVTGPDLYFVGMISPHISQQLTTVMPADFFNSYGEVAILGLVIHLRRLEVGNTDGRDVELPYIETGDIVLKALNSSAGLTRRLVSTGDELS